MQLLKSLIILIVGFVLLIKGADFFVEGSSAVAKRLRIPSMIIGMTIVAMGTSLPETAAKAAKQLWKSKPGMDLRITKPRKPEWLAQNLDNPFRGWDGAEHIPAAAAKKAANQYRKTRSQLMKLAAEPGEDAQAQAMDAVTAYTQTFNKMGFIETEERDEIYMALRGILDALPDSALQKDSLIEKFDELRDF